MTRDGDMRMALWQNVLSRNPIEWLLEKDNPSVRYFTLRDLLDGERASSELEEAKSAIADSKVIIEILSKQNAEGYWETAKSPYLPKYKSTYWQIILLGQLGIDKDDARVERAIEFMFNLQLDEGGFSAYTTETALEKYEWMQTRSALKEKLQPEPTRWAQSLVTEHQYSCLTGNVCAAMLRMGYGEDPRLKKALNWLVGIQSSDGGWLCPYWKAHIKDTHSCFYGTICSLEAFSEVPETERSSEMKDVIEKAVEFLLMHRLYKADHHGLEVINRQWLKFSFPWFYGYNVLRGLSVVTKLGYVDEERIIDAAKVLIQKRHSDGTWLLDNAPTGRMHADIETVGKPSKWITLNGLRILKRLQQTKNKKLKEALVKV